MIVAVSGHRRAVRLRMQSPSLQKALCRAEDMGIAISRQYVHLIMNQTSRWRADEYKPQDGLPRRRGDTSAGALGLLTFQINVDVLSAAHRRMRKAVACFAVSIEFLQAERPYV